ncbi:MAG TPA: 3-hydroxyacyl-CoA dehydrogenase NAD-binding domain-containing protein, partial [Chloroflexota bacterium]|nr:3-hydroxyacyl-CoA dehydrogenase NAD-binding domain-containing protein [Chloroflexota bacterium]
MAAVAGFQRAAVVGTGQMGPGIAMLLAHGGLETVLVSRSAVGAEEGLRQARALLQFWRERELVGDAEAQA